MIRILLVDDQRIIRQGLKALLELDPDLQVVGSADSGQTAIEQVEELYPDIVLIDIRMPGMDGVTATGIISQRFPNTKVLILSGYDDNEYLADAMRAGAKGYLLKDTPAEELANVIRSVDKGYAQIGPGLLEKINFASPVSNPVEPEQVLPEVTPFTPLELEVLRQLKNFDTKALPEVVRFAVAQGAVVELLDQVNNQLKLDPTNLAALYLAGTLLAEKGQAHKMLALHYLRFGFEEGIRQGLSRNDLLLFYQQGILLESGEAFTWLTQIDGPWNNKEGFSFLLQEAARMFGLNSTNYRTLIVLRQFKAMRVLSDGCAPLEPKLKILNQGFERFGKVLKL